MKRNQLLIPLFIVVTFTLSGCINENSIAFSFTAWFHDVEKGAYIYLPAIVNPENETIIELDEYFFENGKGNIEYIQVNGTVMLNISAFTSDIRIKTERKDEPEDKWNLTYSGLYLNNTDVVSKYYTKIYYSGNNRVYSSSSYIFFTGPSGNGFEIGPYYLSHGWNDVRIDGTGWDV